MIVNQSLNIKKNVALKSMCTVTLAGTNTNLTACWGNPHYLLSKTFSLVINPGYEDGGIAEKKYITSVLCNFMFQKGVQCNKWLKK